MLSQCNVTKVYFLTILISCLWFWTLQSSSALGQGVYIQFKGNRLSNNSYVDITDIGEGDNASVRCITNKTNCCRSVDGGALGEWYFPNNGSPVGIQGLGRSFYRNRGPSVVRLHRRNNVTMPTGLFCCVVPDANGTDQRICIIATLRPFEATSIPVNMITSTISIQPSPTTSIESSVANSTTATNTLTSKIVTSATVSGSSTVPTTDVDTTTSRSTTPTDSSSISTPVCTGPIQNANCLKHLTSETNIPVTPIAASAASVLVLLLIILTLACIILLRRKRTQRGLAQKYGTLNAALDIKDDHDKSKPEKLELEEVMDNSKDLNCYQREDKPIPLAQFVEHVDQMHADRDNLFEDEFSSLCTTPQAAHDVSSIPYNDEKNRFLNIFPYDYNRVKLKEIPDVEGSDYINASYLNGYYKQKAYIAAQGPLPNSLEDFWRMIWEQKLPTVVMLTKCFEERKKCECYWPESKEKTLTPGHDLNVKLTSSIPFSDFIIRKMTVKHGLEPDTPPLEVTQLHFTAWPDHGVPSNTSVMLNIIRRVRKIHPYSDPQPLLVHCSAGVGRTGTFIVLDSMLERMKSEKSFNIFEFVQQLREERVFMVQSLAQYMFIHDALKELILCGETEILAPNLGIVINKLSKVKDDCSGFELQFQTLKKLCPKLENDSFSCAMAECNVKKNRYPDRIPCDGSSRMALRWNGEQGSDYINASFIDGYKQRRAYIATQGPLESTVDDFWRMIWEQKSCCIVMLCQLEENDKEMSSHYWPTEDEPQTFGKLMVKKLSHEKRGDIIVRRFEIDEKKQLSLVDLKTAITVTQFQFLVWKEDEIPPIASHLIELVDNVNKVQMGSGNRPMVVMCNDGVGRTGTFICIHAQLERLKTEGVVDFFQFVKSARIQRPGLILSVGQYELCHSTVLQYLQSVDAYANFKDVV